jgi:hypothetical protein
VLGSRTCEGGRCRCCRRRPVRADFGKRTPLSSLRLPVTRCREILTIMIEGKRLKEIADLPLDLAVEVALCRRVRRCYQEGRETGQDGAYRLSTSIVQPGGLIGKTNLVPDGAASNARASAANCREPG